MANRTGGALLPLHGGHVPAWLSTRMAALGRVLVEAIVAHYGRDEVLRRLAHPFWFQSLGAVMGMDWHSSGITTSVLGALKRGLAPVADELGLYVCGGRGRQSRATPSELLALGERTGFDADALVRASRLVAKVDSAAVQDGFELYLHGFVVTREGRWTVVQQGMNTEQRAARRYHWLSEGVCSFVDEPHAAIEGPHGGTIVNLCDRRAAESRSVQVALVARGPDYVVEQLAKTVRPRARNPELLPHLSLPFHHEVTARDVMMRRLHGAIATAAERGPIDFPELLLTPGIGARTVLALAQVAEVVHGAPCRFSDPARFSMAHGGKDGHPFPVPLRVYDETLKVMRDAVARAKMDQADKLFALRALSEQARALESTVNGPSFDEFVHNELDNSARYGGRSVNGPSAVRPARTRSPRRAVPAPQQLELPGLESARRT